MRIIACVVIACFVGGLHAGPAAAVPGCGLRFAVLDTPLTKRLAQDLDIALAQASICAEFEVMPVPRASVLLLEGAVTGEVARIPAYADKVGHVAIRVEPPLYMAKGMLGTLDRDIRRLEDARHLRVGYVRGINWEETLVASMPLASASDNRASLMRQLIEGRLDAVLFSLPGATAIEAQIKNMRMIEAAHLEMSVYLHRDHADKAAAVSAAIAAYDRPQPRF